jgi:glyoxylase-like metal-dependent hydrolase (beta-lactamase superfamily II)
MQSSRRSSHFKPERSSGAEGYGLTFGNQSITTPHTGTLIAGDLFYNGAFALPGERRPAQHDAWLESLNYLESLRLKRVVAGHSKPGHPHGDKSIDWTREYIHDLMKFARSTGSAA